MGMATLVKWGNGQGVRISRYVMESAGVKIGDSFDVRVEGGDIVLVPQQARTVTIPDFESMFAGYKGPGTVDDGFAQPAGGEVL